MTTMQALNTQAIRQREAEILLMAFSRSVMLPPGYGRTLVKG
jgi:hypothetical protein